MEIEELSRLEMVKQVLTGPERQTIFERFVGLFHLPYAAGSSLLAVLLGAPVVLLTEYVSTSSLDNAILVLTGSESVSIWQAVSAETLFVLANFAIFYGIQDMQLRLVRTELDMVPS